jgi:uncharacterized membrane protein
MTDNTADKPGASRKLRIALMVSLALNVLIIGAVAGTFVFGRHHGWKHHKHRGLSGFAHTLPAERGDALREKLKAQRKTLAPYRDAEDKARAEGRKVLTTEPFDAEAFRSAVANAAEADCAEKKARMALFADTVATLTPEERRELHAWFEKRRKRYQKFRKDRDD